MKTFILYESGVQRAYNPNSKRWRARGRAALKYLVVYPVGIVLAVSASLAIGYFASYLGTL